MQPCSGNEDRLTSERIPETRCGKPRQQKQSKFGNVVLSQQHKTEICKCATIIGVKLKIDARQTCTCTVINTQEQEVPHLHRCGTLRFNKSLHCQSVVVHGMVGEKPPSCSDEPYAKWLRDPVNQHTFEVQGFHGSPPEAEVSQPGVQGFATCQGFTASCASICKHIVRAGALIVRRLCPPRLCAVSAHAMACSPALGTVGL
jgi:hypothetical protein